ncbi:MAG TPA: M3 family metallopeptidase [Ilumatobacteraceae bacterium]|nr:M3 family metallopeptidase [Ilumatobacteraceae bacterium]
MTRTRSHRPIASAELPRWSVADLHESLEARSFTDALERAGAGVSRLQALFDEHGVRAIAPRTVDDADAATADAAIDAFNATSDEISTLRAVVYATVSTDSLDERAQSLLSELIVLESLVRPLTARLAEWVLALGVDELATRSEAVREHAGPLRRLAARTDHQMTEAEEGLYAELATTGSSAWSRLQRDVTSQLTCAVRMPDGRATQMSMPAVRGLASSTDAMVRRAAYDAEMEAWPTVATPVAAAINAIKGEANAVNRRRRWESPLEASLFANSVSRSTFDAMHRAILDCLPDFRRWMRSKATLHGHDGGLPWWDLVAPLPCAASDVTWDQGIDIVKGAFATYGEGLAGLVDRALSEQWIDADPRPGKTGGAFCMPLVDDRSLVLLNWSGSLDSTQTAAHELGHAYHNTMLAGRTALQRRLPMALAETASIFCETLVIEAGLADLEGDERLALLDVDLAGSTVVVVDIYSRFLFETEVFARRQRRTLGVIELNEMMLEAQAEAYGEGLDQSTAHPYMWLIKPHYYRSHFYNWPYTFGLLFGLGLFAKFREEPDRFRAGYDDMLSRAGMDTAEQLGQAFDLDVTDDAFWTASLDVVRLRIADYDRLARAT